MNKVYVGNISFGADPQSFRTFFESQASGVVDARLVTDRETNRLKGFGFVTFETTDQRDSAIQSLNGQDYMGRKLIVREAMDRQPDRQPRDMRGGFYSERPEVLTTREPRRNRYQD